MKIYLSILISFFIFYHSHAADESTELKHIVGIVDSMIVEVVKTTDDTRIGADGFQLFSEPRELLDGLFDQVIASKSKIDDNVLNDFLIRYLVLNVRTTDKWEDVVLRAAPVAKESGHSEVLYLLALAEFKYQELGSREGDFSESLRLLNAAIELNPEFPEAYWLRSQIFAIQGGKIDLVISDQLHVKKFEDQINLLLYLYDVKIVEAIFTAVDVNTNLVL